MKLQELEPAFKNCPDVLAAVLKTDRWKKIGADQELPDELVFEAFASHPDRFEISNKHVRLAKSHSANSLSALAVAKKYGGEVIGEVQKYGFFNLGDDSRLFESLSKL